MRNMKLYLSMTLAFGLNCDPEELLGVNNALDPRGKDTTCVCCLYPPACNRPEIPHAAGVEVAPCLLAVRAPPVECGVVGSSAQVFGEGRRLAGRAETVPRLDPGACRMDEDGVQVG